MKPKAITYDGDLVISTANKRSAEKWKRTPLTWAAFITRVSKPTVTPETMAEYMAMSKDEQDRIKDVGGFVAGELAGGRRSKTSVMNRTMFTLDADFANEGLWDSFVLTHGCAAVAYATHKNKPDKPRFRICGPYMRPVTPDEHEAISRKLAEMVGIDCFDSTTYQPSRLMYWPSIPTGVDYLFAVNDDPWLNPDDILALYGPGDAWRDQSLWPESSRTATERKRLAEKQGDPLQKPGVIGAFCRTYSIPEALESFLPDVYEPCATEGRYTFKSGSSSGGLVLYDGDVFAFSHHGTDPISGRLVNAWDLVRLHLYGDLDEKFSSDSDPTKLPSHAKMTELALEDPAVRQTIGEERLAQAKEDFGAAADKDWLQHLDYTKRGVMLSTPQNIMSILENDPQLTGKLTEDVFAHRLEVSGDLPWREKGDHSAWGDKDESGLRNYLVTIYGITGRGLVLDALNGFLLRHRRHPVRDYLNRLEWDGIDRLESLFIDFFGADDNEYTRAVTRKMFVAAVARVMKPGIKFDNLLVLVGKQGIGKSFFLSRMGGAWFSDSLVDFSGKEAYEAIQGVWLLELGELAAMKKAEVEHVKHFLSKQVDRYRAPYARVPVECPRQCVFFGSTNKMSFLRDATGNRRFWPVMTGVRQPARDVFTELTDDEVGMIWAEAVVLFKAGEPLYLDSEISKRAAEIQEAHMEESEKSGLVYEYLERKLPENWADKSILDRRAYYQGDEFGDQPEGTVERTKVCVLEIWSELFNGDVKTITTLQRNEIADILTRAPGWERYTQGTGRLKFGRLYGLQTCWVKTQ